MRMRQLSHFENNNANAVFCDESLGKTRRCRLFSERDGPQIVLFESLQDKQSSRSSSRDNVQRSHLRVQTMKTQTKKTNNDPQTNNENVQILKNRRKPNFEVIFQKRVRGFHQVSKREKHLKLRGRRPSGFIVFERF